MCERNGVYHFQSHSLQTLLLKLSQPKTVGKWFADCSFTILHTTAATKWGRMWRVFNNWVPAPAECWHNYAPLKLHLLSWKTHHSRFSNTCTIMVIHGDSLSIAAWPDPSSLCEKCGLWDYLLVCCCKRRYNWNALVYMYNAYWVKAYILP